MGAVEASVGGGVMVRFLDGSRAGRACRGDHGGDIVGLGDDVESGVAVRERIGMQMVEEERSRLQLGVVVQLVVVVEVVMGGEQGGRHRVGRV